jgi:flavin-dependent dehydrogenase
VQDRVEQVEWVDGKPVITPKNGEPAVYDLAAVATGVNSNALKFLQTMGGEYRPPTTTKTFIREYFFGEDRIAQYLGSSMHVFLLPLKGLEFAALIPKGDCATLCLLGEEIDRDLVQTFMQTPQVAKCFPPDFDIEKGACQCSPRITIDPATEPFRDRMLFIGDCGVTRLYKDGIGAAYRTAKAAATAVVFHGVAAEDFRAHYYPTLRRITKDNNIGKLVFWVTGFIQRLRFTRRGILRMVQAEQAGPATKRRMSTVLWDTFTGSSPYREILKRSLTPAFLTRLAWSTLWPFGRAKTG